MTKRFFAILATLCVAANVTAGTLLSCDNSPPPRPDSQVELPPETVNGDLVVNLDICSPGDSRQVNIIVTVAGKHPELEPKDESFQLWVDLIAKTLLPQIVSGGALLGVD